MVSLNKKIVEKIREKSGTPSKENRLSLRGGDTVWMEYRDYVDSPRYKTFTGICLGKTKKGYDDTVVLRTVIGGVGVEYGFHTLSKNIKKINIVEKEKRRGGRVKRYDLRETTMR